MYAGESAIFLSGHFFVACHQKSLVAANENKNLPSSPSDSMTLKSVLNIHTILREMVEQGNGEKIPARIVDVVKESALRSVRDIDTAWARAIVSGYYNVSGPLGLDLGDDLFKSQMGNHLMSRLKKDIETTSLHFTPYRFKSVQSAFKAMGEDIGIDRADQVKGWVYERFIDSLEFGRGDLAEVTEQASQIIGVVDHAMRYNR
jgi:hypothetical protein